MREHFAATILLPTGKLTSSFGLTFTHFHDRGEYLGFYWPEQRVKAFCYPKNVFSLYK